VEEKSPLVHELLERINRLELENKQLKNYQPEKILESISDAFFSLDNEFRVTYFNSAAEKILGKERETVLGKKLFSSFPEAKGSVFEEKYTRAMKEKEFSCFEVYFDVPPYSNWYDVNVYPSADGISVYFQITTEKKKAEEKLNKQNDEYKTLNEEYLAINEELKEKNEEYATLNEEYATTIEELREKNGKVNSLVAEMKESENKLKAILDSSLMTFILLDKERVILTFNKNFALIARSLFKKEVKSGDLMDEYILDRDLKEFQEDFKLALSGESIRKEKEFKKSGGIHVHVTHYNPVYDDEQNIIGVSINSRDITEMKNAEKKWQEIQLRYETMATNYPNGAIFLVGEDFKYKMVAGKALENMGMGDIDFIGKRAADIFPPNIVKSAEQVVSEIIKGRVVHYQVNFKDNYFANVGVPIKNSQGRVVEALIYSTDITALKKQEKELKQQNFFIQTVLDNLPIGVATNSFEEGEATYINKRFEEIYGWPKSELKNINGFFEKVYPDAEYRQKIKSQIEKDVATKDTSRMHWENIHITCKSGEKRIVNAVNIPLFEQNTMVSTVMDVTEQHIAEQALESSRNMLDSILQASSVGLAYVVDRKFVWTNETMGQLFGYTKAEFVGKDTRILYPDKEEYLRVGRILYEQAYPGDTVQLDTCLARKDGTIFIGHYKIRQLDLNDPGKGIIASVIDISERIKAERALAASEAKFRSMVENVNDIIYTINPEGIFTYVSPIWKEILGYELDEVLGKPFQNFLFKEDVPAGWEYLEQVLEEKGSNNNVEYRVLHKDGSTRWQISNGAPLYDEEGKTIAFLGVARDITEKKAIEDEHGKIRENLTEAEKIANIGNWEFRLNEGKVFASEGAKKIYGLHDIKQELTIDFAQKVPLTEYREMLDNALEALIKHDKKYNVEFKIKRLDNGEIRDIYSVARYNKEQHTVFGILKDITSEKLHEHELLLAKEKAEESDKLKSSFLANMSHEIRTPMNGIIGFSEMITDPGLSRDKIDYFAKIVVESGKKLLSIVNDLLDISRIETGQVKIKTEEVKINDLMEELHVFFKPRAEELSLDFNLEMGLDNDKNVILTDRTRLYQILNNLLGNAFKYTNEGHIHFGYKLEKGMLKFWIEDTGIGIPAELHDKIFERFRQAELEVSRKYGGAGLGLAISKKLAELLNGEIWLESDTKKGSIFYLTIPYTHVKRGKKTVDSSVESVTNQIAGETILIVEDDEVNMVVIQELLRSTGARILKACNGREAIEACKKNQGIKLVLMDIKMPVMDGYQATAAIKKIRPNLPIIAQTAFAMIEDKEKAMKAGCDDYIPKPLNRDVLLEKILKFMK